MVASLVKRVGRKFKSYFKRIEKSFKKPKPFFTKDILKNTKYNIGDFSYGGPKVLHWGETATLKIGKFCSIAENVSILLGGNHRMDWVTTYPFPVLSETFPGFQHIEGLPATKGDVVIGNDVWIGYSVIILSGVTIADGAVITAGAVITKNVGPYEVWGGNPAKFIKKRFSDEIINRLMTEKWWDWPIEKIKKNIPSLCSLPE